MKEPIFLEPFYKQAIWGGNQIKQYFNREEITKQVAESWEVSTNEHGKSIVKNGRYQGKTLEQVFQEEEVRREIFGNKMINEKKFPLLIKYIDANQNLSVQVHPDDVYAKENENSLGKTEMWYIIDCKENAKIILGMKEGTKQEEIKEIIEQNKIKEYMQEITVVPGDIIYIPSGTIHAILGGILICEVQQNSDITYRIYDWDRVGNDGKPRQLHIKQAIDTIKVNQKLEVIHTNQIKQEKKEIVDSQYFKVEKLRIEDIYCESSNPDTFYTFNVVKGKGVLKVEAQEYTLMQGDSFILPASLGEYELVGNMELIRSYV